MLQFIKRATFAGIVNCLFNPSAAFLLPVPQSPLSCLSCLQLRDLCSDNAALTGVRRRTEEAGWDVIDQMRLAIVDSFDWVCGSAVGSISSCQTVHHITSYISRAFPVQLSLTSSVLTGLHSFCFESRVGKHLAWRDPTVICGHNKYLSGYSEFIILRDVT